jgi:undecaprenyl diphosphate synthase
VAFDYGSHAEMVHAARQAAATGEPVDVDAISRQMYLPHLPPVDVLVRTSGEVRISHFMLWQSAGTEVYFTEKAWPDFDAAELDAALALVR